MRPAARSRDGFNGHRKQARVEPQRRHPRGQPQRGGQVRRRLAGRQPGHPGEPAQPPRDRVQHRQAVTRRRPRRRRRPGRLFPRNLRQQPGQPLPEHAGPGCEPRPPRPRRRRRHHPPAPRPAAHGRAAARPAAAASAPSTSTVMITSAPYRRRDHSTAGSSTCVRPHPRHRPRRGRNGTQPSGIAISRNRAKPHLASTPPHGQRSTPRLSRDSTLDPEPHTVTTRCHLRHRRAAFPGVTAKRSRGGPLPPPTRPR